MIGLLLLFISAFVLLIFIGSAGILIAILRPKRKTYAVAVALDCPTDPSDLEMVGQEVTFNLPGNHTSPGWIIEGDRPDGPTVIVLHGHRDSRYGALYRAKDLVPHAAHVVVFDWPAHGDCTAKIMTFGEREPGDVAAVLDGLPPSLTEKPVVLFGYSLGAQIAIKTAVQVPRFFGVIADSPYRYWSSPIKKRGWAMGYPVRPFLPLVWAVLSILGPLRHFDRAAWAAQMEVPLLVLHGTADRICPHEEGRQIAEAAKQGEFVSIPGGRHIHLASDGPELYHGAIERFFGHLHAAGQTTLPRVDTLNV